MLSQFKKGLLFAALVVASLSAVSTAGATTATITGGPTVSGTTSGAATLLKLHNSGKTLSCTGSTASGTVAASTTGILPLRVGTITPAFTTCNIVGGLGITVNCQPAALNVNATTVGNNTAGSISGVSCHIFVTTQTACRITVTGSVGATHSNNPSKITTDTNHQSLAAGNSTNGAGAACNVLPNDASARFTNATGGDLVYTDTPTNLTLNVS